MAQEQLSALSDLELHKKAKFLKFAVGFFGASMALMIISGIILSIRKGFSGLSLTAIGFLPLMMIFSMQLKQVQAELKKRNG